MDGRLLVTHLLLLSAKANRLEDQSHVGLWKRVITGAEHMVEDLWANACAKSPSPRGYRHAARLYGHVTEFRRRRVHISNRIGP